MKLPPGKCVFINPAYSNKNEGSVPLLKSLKIPQAIRDIEEYNQQRWANIVSLLARKSTQKFPTQQNLDMRIANINNRFPLSQNTPEVSNNSLPLDMSEVSSLIDVESNVFI